MNKRLLWRGLSAVLLFLLIVVIAATSCAVAYEDMLNNYFGLSTSGSELSKDPSAIYFKSEFGALNEASQNKLIQATKEQTIREMEEGAVLLRNEANALPLSSKERSVTFFGRACVDVVYRNHSAGNTPTDDTAVTLQQAFGAENFEINPTLWDAYKSSNVKRDNNVGKIGEVGIDFYTSTIRASWENKYNDVAFIFLARESGEGADLFMKDADGVSELSLHKSERDMVEMVTSSGKFGKVIVILNTAAAMELDWLKEYNIDACIWMGTPGDSGFTGLANIIVGKANPSGHLSDTYAANSLSAPATVGSGTNTLTYANSNEINSKVKDSGQNTNYYTIYHEGIYVGYKYYETRYEDCVLGQGGASDKAGSSTGSEWSYADEIVYPFGYGLSYTNFSQTLDDVKDNGDGTVTVTVTVKNEGTTAGKYVVQIYAQTPYGTYEKENSVEKSAIQLWNFGKTKLLEPDEPQTLEIVCDKYLLASYDYTTAKTYIMSEGQYYLALGTDAHDALNNVLAAKEVKEGLVDQNGNSVEGKSALTYTWNEEFDKETYSKSTKGVSVTNQFDDCDINYYIKDAVTYLTRSNWKDTYPVTAPVISANDAMIKALSGETYVKPANAPTAKSIPQGENKGISLLSMKGLDYEDAKWDDYLSQMTVEEMSNQLIDGFGTKAVASVGKPATKTSDGIDSIEGKLPYGSKPRNNVYTAKVVLTSTWNSDLYRRRGELMGEEALFGGYVCIFDIGGDLHRTQFGGRNPEYTSEDGVLGYYVAIPEAEGVLSKGVNPAIKHFAGNDQEFQRSGLCTFFNEQSFREINLKIFEGALKVAGSHAFMQGLHRLGCTYDPAHAGLNTGVLREEWKFQGFAETDGTAGTGYQLHFKESLTAGTSVYCLDTTRASGPAIKKAIETTDDGYILQALRRAVKDIHFATVNSPNINGYTATTAVVEGSSSWWPPVLYTVIAVLAAATLGCGFMFVKEKYGIKLGKNKEATND